MKKRISYLLLVAIIVISLTGCFEKEVEPKNNDLEVSIGEIVVPPVTEVEEKEDFDFIKEKDEIFINDISVGIANITNENEESTINKYFVDKSSYDSLDRYDYRNGSEFVDRFLVIPKDKNVVIDICDCVINELGELLIDNTIVDDITSPFILLVDDIESTIPRYCLNIKIGDFTSMIPLSFSGYDGSLVLAGHENEAVDLTIY